MSQDNIQSQVHKNLIFKYLWKSWKRTQNQTACETANRMEVGGEQKENAWQIHMKCPRQLLSAQKWFYGILCRKRNKKIKELSSKDQVAFSLILDL